MSKDLHELPKLRDSISYLYFEHAIIEQSDSSIVVITKDGRIPVPIASVTCILLGPGTNITHAAIKAMSENGCSVIWCGESAGRFYAYGTGETRSAENLILQAKLCMDPDSHMAVVRNMYSIRFPNVPTEGLTLQQIRGLEGVRVRQTYQMEAKRCGVQWKKRKYKQTTWEDSDDINKALSYANSILYGICQASVVSLGFSPGLGFIHTGKQLSFVYDIADLYKTETSIPAAFEAVMNGKENLESRVRIIIRQKLTQAKIMRRIPDDLERIFSVPLSEEQDNLSEVGDIWDVSGIIRGGHNHAGDSQEWL